MKTKTEDLTGKQLYGAFREYKNGKAELDETLKEHEKWWRAQGDAQAGAATPYLFNAVWNKHAGAMDNFPEPTFLERELSDKPEAERLTDIVPLVLERNCFYSTYSDAWWRKLKNGFAVYFVFWDKELENGLGDVGIRCIDGLRFYAEPHCEDIQKSKYVFVTSEMDRAAAERRYKKADFKKPEQTGPDYFHEQQDDDSVQIIDCYERVVLGGSCTVHLTKLYGETVLYSTKTDPLLKEFGLYEHGMYPFVLDTMIPCEKSLFGMGMLDLGGSMQQSLDRLDRLIEKNNLVAARQRFLLKRSAGVDRNALLDMDNDVVEADSTVDDGAVRPIQAAALPAGVLQSRIAKAEDLKEILGNRDFQQGSVTGGVTAYSAIVALQESGNKLERDLIAASYESFRQLIGLVVELIRQFYTEERVFRITGKNLETTYLAYANDGLRPRPYGAGQLFRKPVFDIKITAQKQSPFLTAQHNELCMQLYQLGAFHSDNAAQAAILLSNLILPGKENLLRAVKDNLESAAEYPEIPVQ